MTDVQSQLEANGLPTKFSTTTETPLREHAAINTSATESNADKVIPASLESSMLVEPVASKEPSVIPESSPLHGDQTMPDMNGTSKPGEHGTDIHVNGHDGTQAPAVTSDLQVTASPVAPATVSINVADSLVPSSIPSESAAATLASGTSSDPLAVAPSITSIAPVDQIPVSDIRTIPHSDNLPPEAVANIEERKHVEDDAADLAPAHIQIEQTPASAPVQVESASVSKIGLPSPPGQTPPPAPEMSHTALPSNGVSAPAAAPAHVSPAAELPVEAAAMQPEDAVMEDAPAVEATQVPKIARERDDESAEEEPLAKRIRTDTDQTEFKIPEPPTPSVFSDVNAPISDGNDAVTSSRLAHMKKVISNLKKSNASAAFRTPVDYVLLKIPTYPDIVKKPMDLGTIDNKLKKNEYTSVKDFVTEFSLIVNNCVLFNGPEHGVSQQAFKMQSSFNNQMQALPKASETEPSKAEKKAMKLKTEPIRAAPPRRQSVTTPISAKSPKSVAPATPSFAPGPDGVPLIRRDSSIVDGRPKRAIVPPKRNSDFSGVRPKKKKYELQLRFCEEVLKEISSTKHWQSNQYFTHPVDPVSLNIPTYFQVIKKPMDLGTVGEKLKNNQYEKAKDFEEDVRLIFKNCYKFNPEGDYVHNMGRSLEELFDRKWAQKDDWIAAREPHSEPSEPEEEEEEEASEEEEDSEDDRNEKIKALQAQIEAMSKQMGELTQSKKKKKTTPPVAKTKKTKTKKEKAPAQFPGLTKTKDKKKASKPKGDKDRYVTFQEKQYISNGIGMLPEKQMQEALRIIQNSVPTLANNGDGEIELDIEEVPNHALLRLLSFVRKYAPPPPEEVETKHEVVYSSAPTKSKKNKPMSKQEQEAQIEELKGKVRAYADPISPGTMQSGDTGNDTSDDSADSEESEEE